MSKKVKKRLITILLSVLVLLIATLLITINLRDNIIYFYSPSELQETTINKRNIIRVGGLVKEGSYKYNDKTKIYSFVITDNSNEVNVSFVGIIPNLFAENKGVVVEGLAIDKVNFTALKVLAKHDENYMPPEVIEALKQEGQWQEE
ncbi:cytochrome c maturation protein CcmE [Pelagibacterales bacterium]|jgi:cytochrome c-type biogenesis protein CcmE|nr:cytochrome c maturation protein CcmE [Pelagibacterales bacterium]